MGVAMSTRKRIARAVAAIAGSRPIKVSPNETMRDFKFPTIEALEDTNEDFVWENGHAAMEYAYSEAIRRGATEKAAEAAAESAREEAEGEAQDEIFKLWKKNFETIQGWYEFHGLDLEYENIDEAFVTPEISWEDAAERIRESINGYGEFEFNDLQEFLSSGPYTPREAVESHLHWIARAPAVYGGPHPPTRRNPIRTRHRMTLGLQRLSHEGNIGIPPKLTRKELDEVNEALLARGLDGNKRFDRPGEAVQAVFEALAEAELQPGGVFRADLFLQEQGHVNLPIEYILDDPFTPIEIQNAGLTVTWYKFDTGRWEFIAYVS